MYQRQRICSFIRLIIIYSNLLYSNLFYSFVSLQVRLSKPITMNSEDAATKCLNVRNSKCQSKHDTQFGLRVAERHLNSSVVVYVRGQFSSVS